jgi:hypothetical protein
VFGELNDDSSRGARGSEISKTTIFPGERSVATIMTRPSSDTDTSPVVTTGPEMVTEPVFVGVSPLISQMSTRLPGNPLLNDQVVV